MLFWQYCLISTPRHSLTVPDNLKQFMPIVSEVIAA